MGLYIKVVRECDWCAAEKNCSSRKPPEEIVPEGWLLDEERLFCPECAPYVSDGRLPPLEAEAAELLELLQAVPEGDYLTKDDYEWTLHSHRYVDQLAAYGHPTRMVVDDQYHEFKGFTVFIGEPPDMWPHILGWQLGHAERGFVYVHDLPVPAE